MSSLSLVDSLLFKANQLIKACLGIKKVATHEIHSQISFSQISLGESCDRMRWRLNENGMFNVHSYYACLVDLIYGVFLWKHLGSMGVTGEGDWSLVWLDKSNCIYTTKLIYTTICILLYNFCMYIFMLLWKINI